MLLLPEARWHSEMLCNIIENKESMDKKYNAKITSPTSCSAMAMQCGRVTSCLQLIKVISWECTVCVT